MGGFASLRRRITDPEILERRYPVILREYQLRPGSGGDGEFRGGDGVVREVRQLWAGSLGFGAWAQTAIGLANPSIGMSAAEQMTALECTVGLVCRLQHGECQSSSSIPLASTGLEHETAQRGAWGCRS